MPIKNQRVGFRFSLTTALMFIVGMIVNWESAYLAAVYVTILLEGDKRIPFKAGIILLLTTCAIYLLVFSLFTLLLQYPLFFFLALFAGLASVFVMSIAGKSNLIVTLSLFGVIIIPYTTVSSVDAAWTLAIWMPLNFSFALVASWCAFAIMPPIQEEGASTEQVRLHPVERKRRLILLLISVAPIILIFQLIEGDHLLSILYFGLFSIQLLDSSDNSSVSPTEKLIANLFAVLSSLIAYELIVIAPTITMLSLVSLLLCLVYGWWLCSGYKNANLARSGLTGAIILLGNSIAPMADTVETASVERIIEISAAVILVTMVFTVTRKLLCRANQPATEVRITY